MGKRGAASKIFHCLLEQRYDSVLTAVCGWWCMVAQQTQLRFSARNSLSQTHVSLVSVKLRSIPREGRKADKKKSNGNSKEQEKSFRVNNRNII